MTHSHIWYDSFIYVTWRIHVCDMTHYVFFGQGVCECTYIYVTNICTFSQMTRHRMNCHLSDIYIHKCVGVYIYMLQTYVCFHKWQGIVWIDLSVIYIHKCAGVYIYLYVTNICIFLKMTRHRMNRLLCITHIHKCVGAHIYMLWGGND